MAKFEVNLMFGCDGQEKSYIINTKSSMASDREIKLAAFEAAKEQDIELTKQFYYDEIRLTFFKKV